MSGTIDGSSTVTSGIPNYKALALLSLPAALSDPQKNGNVCVWGGESLTPDTAVQLDSRTLDGRTVYPRACRSCVSRLAMTALASHALPPDACTDCREEPLCDLGQALNRLIRKTNR